MQVLEPLLRPPLQLTDLAELDGIGWAGLRAGRFQAALQAVVAQRALMSLAIQRADVHHTERAGRHAIAAAVADVLLHHDGVEFGAEQRSGGASLDAGR